MRAGHAEGRPSSGPIDDPDQVRRESRLLQRRGSFAPGDRGLSSQGDVQEDFRLQRELDPTGILNRLLQRLRDSRTEGMAQKLQRLSQARDLGRQGLAFDVDRLLRQDQRQNDREHL